MKNEIKTKTIVVTIPTDEIDEIDKRIKLEKNYTNRPDYILTAIRHTLMWLKNEFSRLSLECIDQGMSKKEREKVQIFSFKCQWLLLRTGYNYYGTPIRVYLRIPEGIMESIKEFTKNDTFDNEPHTISDFIRLSISRYFLYEGSENILYLPDDFTTNEVIEGIVEHLRLIQNNRHNAYPELEYDENTVEEIKNGYSINHKIILKK